MGSQALNRVTRAELFKAGELLHSAYTGESNYPDSPVSRALVKVNLDHATRVRALAVTIATGEGLDPNLLELTAILHDISKLDRRDTKSGGIDTWHHHHKGASLATKLILADLGLGGAVAETVAGMILTHSDIPFISRYWEQTYGIPVPSPRTHQELAFRDADTLDLLWLGGISKIILFRQVPGSAFYDEDEGDIRNAIASAKKSFDECLGVISTGTGKKIAQRRVETVESFFELLPGVRTLQEFTDVYDTFVEEIGIPVC